MQRLVDQWSTVDAELRDLVQRASAPEQQAVLEEAPATSDDEFELGEEELSLDLPLTCEALGDETDTAGIVESRAARRSDDELGLHLVDDLLRELAQDAGALRAALQREGEAIAELEQELICLDETEKLAAELHGPVLDGARAWWGVPEDPHAAGAHVEAPLGAAQRSPSASADDEATTASSELRADADADADPDADAAADAGDDAITDDADDEQWLELDDEELPRDMPLSCDVLGEGLDDEEHAEAEDGESAERTAIRESGVAPEELEPATLVEAEPHALAESPQLVDIAADDDDDARTLDVESGAADDEFELGEEDPTLDLPLTCEALGDEDAPTSPVETRAARRSDDELGLHLVDDLLRELAQDAGALRDALQREGEAIAELEQELICLDETEKLAAELHGPVLDGARAWWGVPEDPHAAGAHVEAPLGAAQRSPSASADDEATTASSELRADADADADPDADAAADAGDDAITDDADDEQWLELDDEELPRDMPLSCDVLGEGLDDEEHAEAEDGESAERTAIRESGVAPEELEPATLVEAEPHALAESPQLVDIAADDDDDARTLDVESGAADDEFELGEEEPTLDLPLTCEALGDETDSASPVETRAARRSDDDLGLHLVDDLLRELAQDAGALRDALQREGEAIAELEEELICLDETAPSAEGGEEAQIGSREHEGLRPLAGDAAAEGGELRFARRAEATLPPDEDVIAELDEPEQASADDEEEWLELDEEELPRDLPLHCSAFGDEDEESASGGAGGAFEDEEEGST